jgi:transcriptional regulator with XRE-family HTH domain
MESINFKWEDDKPALKQVRTALGLTQRQFGDLLRVEASTISRWEKGERVPMFTLEQFKALNEAIKPLGLTVLDLPNDLSAPPQ